MHDIQALSGMLGYGAQKGSKFDAIPLYSGVELKTFFTDKEVGVFTAGKRVKITGSDGSSVTYTYDQVFNGKTGDFVTYDANGNAVTTEANLATKPAITINFWLGGNILGSDIGPLESGILYGQMLYTDSAYWIKVVSKIEVIGP
jgi:ribosomal protein L21E